MLSEYTGILLAGGLSRRMGKDKALLKMRDTNIITHLYNLLCNIFQEVLIIANDDKKYDFLTSKICKDIYPDFGPLSGVHSGLHNSNNKKNFIISCDLPFLNEDIIKFIIQNDSVHDIILPKSGNTIHSLCGIYTKNCLTKASELLEAAQNNKIENEKKNKIRLFDLINSMDTKLIEISDHNFLSDEILFNMNTIDDYEYVKNEISKKT